MKPKFGLLLFFLLFGALAGFGQQKPKKQYVLQIGWYQRFENERPIYPDNQLPNWQTRFYLLTIGIEKQIGKWASLQFGFGSNFLGPHKNPDYKKFNTHIESELRYYMFLRRGRPNTGIYAGLFADMNRIRWKYRDSNRMAVRTSWEDLGTTFGYQHSFGKHFKFNEGLVANLQSIVRTNIYNPDATVLRNERVIDAWYAYYFYVKFAYAF